jgi:xanthine/uracil permease
MNNPFLRFTIKAILVMALVFAVHLFVLNTLNYQLFENRIVASYCINLFLVVLIFGALYLLKEKYNNQLGFLFMAGSIIKFAFFFIFFYPFYKQDGDLSKLEFAAFFTPYVTGLILETISLSKWLNSM